MMEELVSERLWIDKYFSDFLTITPSFLKINLKKLH